MVGLSGSTSVVVLLAGLALVGLTRLAAPNSDLRHLSALLAWTVCASATALAGLVAVTAISTMLGGTVANHGGALAVFIDLTVGPPVAVAAAAATATIANPRARRPPAERSW